MRYSIHHNLWPVHDIKKRTLPPIVRSWLLGLTWTQNVTQSDGSYLNNNHARLFSQEHSRTNCTASSQPWHIAHLNPRDARNASQRFCSGVAYAGLSQRFISIATFTPFGKNTSISGKPLLLPICFSAIARLRFGCSLTICVCGMRCPSSHWWNKQVSRYSGAFILLKML